MSEEENAPQGVEETKDVVEGAAPEVAEDDGLEEDSK